MGDIEEKSNDENAIVCEKLFVTVKTQKESQSIETTENCLISCFKECLKPKFNAEPENMLLIFAGKVMKDNMTLKQHNVQNGYTIHLVIKIPQPQTTTQSENINQGNNRGSFGVPNSTDLSDLNFIESISLNEETIRRIIDQLPQIQSLLETTPQFTQILNNSSLIRQTLSMATRSPIIQEIVRQYGSGVTHSEEAATSSSSSNSRSLDQLTNVREAVREAASLISSLHMPGNPNQNQQTINNENVQVPPENVTNTNNNQSQGTENPLFSDLIQEILHNNDIFQSQLPSQNNNINSVPNFASQTERLTTLLSSLRERRQENDLANEERYRNELDQLVSMGFENRNANLRALVATFGNINAAVDRLLSQNE